MAGVQYGFGSGRLYGIRSDIANSTPVQFGTLQDVSIEFDAEIKELYGQLQYSVDGARGKAKITGKAKFANISPLLFNNLFFGQTETTGTQKLFAYNEQYSTSSIAAMSLATIAATSSGNTLHFTPGSVPTGVDVGSYITDTTHAGVIPAGSYVLTNNPSTGLVTINNNVTGAGVASGDTIVFSPYIYPSNAATFDTDLGVVYASTGVPLVSVFGEPAPGEYFFAPVTKVYLFNPADASTQMQYSYTYTSATGNTIAGSNLLMGSTPKFMAVFEQSYGGNTTVLKLYSCVSTKLSLPTKIDDYTIPELDFSAFANGAGLVFDLSMSAT